MVDKNIAPKGGEGRIYLNSDEEAERKPSPESSGNHESPLLTMTVQLASAYVGNNALAPDEMPQFLEGLYTGLRRIVTEDAMHGGARQKPAVPIAKSVTPDYLVCLEDGKTLKVLKRHLKKTYNMTPEQYRNKWDLPPDYPMVAPNYTKQRSRLAKDIGLGTSGRRPS